MKTIRLITAADISAVMQIQATAYPIAYQESAEVFLARVQAAPLSCWILEQDNLASAYLFSYLSKKGRITSLNTSFTITEDADCLYLHDLAVSPQLRGQGAGDALIANAFNYVYDKKLAWSALVSVQQS
ncbi:MAG: GNAT family N-acetyltransferase [Glaciimonas sp.]|nr:GNAT family N-acetyltransferase [Glaciimonas sp.]